MLHRSRRALVCAGALLAVAVLLPCVTSAEPAPAAASAQESAQEEGGAPQPPDLEVRLRVSGWAAAWGGDVEARGAATDVSATLDESFELENLGASAEIDVRWRRFLLLAGGSFADFDDDLETPAFSASLGPGFLDLAAFQPGLPQRFLGLAIPQLTATVTGGDVDVDVQQIQGELLLGYRLASLPLPVWLGGAERRETRRFDFDLLAGVRYTDLETRIDVSIPAAEVAPFVATAFLFEGPFLFDVPVASSPELIAALLPLFEGDIDFGSIEIPGFSLAGLQHRFEADAHWLDPVLGVRLGLDVTECLRLRLRGDVGGFGLGSAADFAWTAELAVVVRLTQRWEAELAWLAAGIDRDRGAGAIDVLQHGPRAGVSFRF